MENGPERNRLDRGATAVEYALLITAIAVVIVTGVYIFGGSVSSLFTNACETAATQSGGAC